MVVAYGDECCGVGALILFQDDLNGCSGGAACGYTIETAYACLTWFHFYSEEGMGEYLVHLIAYHLSWSVMYVKNHINFLLD